MLRFNNGEPPVFKQYEITMIYDKLTNMSFYKGLSTDIYAGLLFLNAVTKDLENGVYIVNPNVKAIVSEYITIVSEYITKEVNEYGYEAHREYIDIQYLISGEEKILFLPLEYLKETKSYNAEQDAAFYEKATINPQEILIGNGYFAILFPQDGHMPQLNVNKPEIVKKVVVKVRIGE